MGGLLFVCNCMGNHMADDAYQLLLDTKDRGIHLECL
jgi:hypothetical protein